MVVGVGGGQYYSPHGNETGGGGGSFVKNATTNQPLLIAGGAGGSPSSNWGWSCSRPTSWARGQSGQAVEDQLVTITLHNLVMGMVEIPVVDTWVVLVVDT